MDDLCGTPIAPTYGKVLDRGGDTRFEHGKRKRDLVGLVEDTVCPSFESFSIDNVRRSGAKRHLTPIFRDHRYMVDHTLFEEVIREAFPFLPPPLYGKSAL